MQAIYRSKNADTMDPYSGTPGQAYPDSYMGPGHDIDTFVFFPDTPQADDPVGIGFYVDRAELETVQ